MGAVFISFQDRKLLLRYLNKITYTKCMKQSRLLNFTEPRSQYNDGEHFHIAKWRKKIVERDKDCKNCDNSISDPHRNRKIRMEAHHVIPRHHGGRNTINNGITLCTFCHDYFDYMYFVYGMDYFQISNQISKEQRINEIKRMMDTAYFHHLLNIVRS